MAIHELSKKELEELSRDQGLRVAVAKLSFFHFLVLYLSHLFELEPADFHADIVDSFDSVDEFNKYIAIIGFRGSAKSTLTEAFAIWSLVNDKHNYIMYLGNTMDDSKQALANIKDEIEENEKLRHDFNIELENSKSHGFKEKWSEGQLTIRNCTIQAKSKGAKVRGVKFKKARLDLIIGDDLEDVKDAETAEKRKKTRQWFFSEVLPAAKKGALAEHVKVVLIGNYVHRDCLLARLAKGNKVKVHRFALLDENGEITWKGLYPDMKAVQEAKDEVMLAGEGLGHVIWAREYLLKDVDQEDMILKREDIQYYDDSMLQRKAISAGVGVDFAISKKQTADYTAMVKGQDIKNDDGERRMLVMKNNVEKRMGFEETISKALEIDDIMPQGTKWYPEDVGYQKAAIEIMKKKGLNVVPQKATKDKKSRITSACYYIKTGRVLFPKTGAENLIDNLVGFGIEDHDDLADAFAHLVLGMIKKKGGAIIG